MIPWFLCWSTHKGLSENPPSQTQVGGPGFYEAGSDVLYPGEPCSQGWSEAFVLVGVGRGGGGGVLGNTGTSGNI